MSLNSPFLCLLISIPFRFFFLPQITFLLSFPLPNASFLPDIISLLFLLPTVISSHYSVIDIFFLLLLPLTYFTFLYHVHFSSIYFLLTFCLPEGIIIKFFLAKLWNLLIFTKVLTKEKKNLFSPRDPEQEQAGMDRWMVLMSTVISSYNCQFSFDTLFLPPFFLSCHFHVPHLSPSFYHLMFPSLTCVISDFKNYRIILSSLSFFQSLLPCFHLFFFYFVSLCSFTPQQHLSSPQCVHSCVHVSMRGRRFHKCCRLWHVGFWCRWVGVTLKMFPASLTQSPSSTRRCQYILHRCISTVGVSVSAVLDVCLHMCVREFLKSGSLSRPSSYVKRGKKNDIGVQNLC